MKQQVKNLINNPNKLMAICGIIALMFVCRYFIIPMESIIMMMATTKVALWSMIGLCFVVLSIYVYQKIFKRADVKKALKSVLWMILIIGVYGCIMTILFGVGGETSNDTIIKETIMSILDYKLALIIQFTIIMIMAPVMEELIYRFLMYKGFSTVLREKYDYLIMAAMSFTFAIIHVHYNDDWRVMVIEFLSYIVPAMLLTYFYVKNKREVGNEKAYYTNVLIHSFYNTFVVILMILPIILYLIGA